jgi:hypothetical protein
VKPSVSEDPEKSQGRNKSERAALSPPRLAVPPPASLWQEHLAPLTRGFFLAIAFGSRLRVRFRTIMPPASEPAACWAAEWTSGTIPQGGDLLDSQTGIGCGADVRDHNLSAPMLADKLKQSFGMPGA